MTKYADEEWINGGVKASTLVQSVIASLRYLASHLSHHNCRTTSAEGETDAADRDMPGMLWKVHIIVAQVTIKKLPRPHAAPEDKEIRKMQREISKDTWNQQSYTMKVEQ